MSKLDELIAELCPDGVEYKTLQDITKAVNIGINPRKFFKLNPEGAKGFYVTVRELNGLQGVKQCDKTDLIDLDAVKIINDRANIEIGDILFSNTGTVGKMALVIEPPNNWGVNEGIYVIKPKNEIIESKFLYYLLSGKEAYNDYSSKFTGSTVKHITQAALLSLSIPVPPLPVQQEIVRILDNFTELTAELKAEIEARKKQYEYYR
ncbi:MAG TPA: restriction endonuclease subunit S, partial [Fervidobacterium sp.]|nr:restriction endonuclease subunit S [Fervidobacterium sp.]